MAGNSDLECTRCPHARAICGPSDEERGACGAKVTYCLEVGRMRIGVIFPQTEITEDPVAVRDYAQAAEALGYTHVLAFDHVVGADTTNRPHWGERYTVHSLFHEPLVL